jgi:hypothetical protein
MQPSLEGGKHRRRQRQLARRATLATTYSQLTTDQVEVSKVDGDRLCATEPATVGQGQEGGVTPAAGGGILTLPFVMKTTAGLEEAAQLAAGEVAAARF